MKSVLFIMLLVSQLFFSCNDSNKPSYQAYSPKEHVSFQGKNIALYDYENFEKAFLNNKNDTTYIINFWATWCIPCIKELPYFEALSSKYKNEKIKVLLVSLDFSNKIESRLIPFLKTNKITSQVVVLDDADANTWINAINPDWSGAIPATIVYNKHKKAFFEKSFEQQELNNIVETFIN